MAEEQSAAAIAGSPGRGLAAIRHVVWDWNGTLFDDLDAALGTINAVLGEYGLARLADLAAYRSVFTFPVSAYYDRLGLGPASGRFEEAAARYMAVWAGLSAECRLRPGAEEALRGVRSLGLGQAVVSASRRDNLAIQMAPFGLEALLDAALGIDDIYAASKHHVARGWLNRLAEQGIAAPEVLFVGDTAHDVEIARDLGARAALVEGGHMSAESARTLDVPVLAGPDDVLALLAAAQGLA